MPAPTSSFFTPTSAIRYTQVNHKYDYPSTTYSTINCQNSELKKISTKKTVLSIPNVSLSPVLDGKVRSKTTDNTQSSVNKNTSIFLKKIYQSKSVNPLAQHLLHSPESATKTNIISSTSKNIKRRPYQKKTTIKTSPKNACLEKEAKTLTKHDSDGKSTGVNPDSITPRTMESLTPSKNNKDPKTGPPNKITLNRSTASRDTSNRNNKEQSTAVKNTLNTPSLEFCMCQQTPIKSIPSFIPLNACSDYTVVRDTYNQFKIVKKCDAQGMIYNKHLSITTVSQAAPVSVQTSSQYVVNPYCLQIIPTDNLGVQAKSIPVPQLVYSNQSAKPGSIVSTQNTKKLSEAIEVKITKSEKKYDSYDLPSLSYNDEQALRQMFKDSKMSLMEMIEKYKPFQSYPEYMLNKSKYDNKALQRIREIYLNLLGKGRSFEKIKSQRENVEEALIQKPTAVDSDYYADDLSLKQKELLDSIDGNALQRLTDNVMITVNEKYGDFLIKHLDPLLEHNYTTKSINGINSESVSNPYCHSKSESLNTAPQVYKINASTIPIAPKVSPKKSVMNEEIDEDALNELLNLHPPPKSSDESKMHNNAIDLRVLNGLLNDLKKEKENVNKPEPPYLVDWNVNDKMGCPIYYLKKVQIKDGFVDICNHKTHDKATNTNSNSNQSSFEDKSMREIDSEIKEIMFEKGISFDVSNEFETEQDKKSVKQCEKLLKAEISQQKIDSTNLGGVKMQTTVKNSVSAPKEVFNIQPKKSIILLLPKGVTTVQTSLPIIPCTEVPQNILLNLNFTILVKSEANQYGTDGKNETDELKNTAVTDSETTSVIASNNSLTTVNKSQVNGMAKVGKFQSATVSEDFYKKHLKTPDNKKYSSEIPSLEKYNCLTMPKTMSINNLNKEKDLINAATKENHSNEVKSPKVVRNQLLSNDIVVDLKLDTLENKSVLTNISKDHCKIQTETKHKKNEFLETSNAEKSNPTVKEFVQIKMSKSDTQHPESPVSDDLETIMKDLEKLCEDKGNDFITKNTAPVKESGSQLRPNTDNQNKNGFKSQSVIETKCNPNTTLADDKTYTIVLPNRPAVKLDSKVIVKATQTEDKAIANLSQKYQNISFFKVNSSKISTTKVENVPKTSSPKKRVRLSNEALLQLPNIKRPRTLVPIINYDENSDEKPDLVINAKAISNFPEQTQMDFEGGSEKSKFSKRCLRSRVVVFKTDAGSLSENGRSGTKKRRTI